MANPFISLPKVLLHEHLDGGLRPLTLLELCRARNVSVPVDTAPALADWMHANANSGSLVRYLRGFDITVAAMATPEACERVAFEAAEDARADGCVLAEFRMAPLLLEPHGLTGEEAVEAFLAGLKRSSLAAGLIVCGMRTDPPEKTLRSARIAARYRDQGVVAFDLAGAEKGIPLAPHAPSMRAAMDAGLGITCHAGEADVGAGVLEAASYGATRIGHGINVVRGPDEATTRQWIDEARSKGLHFEVCPSSNVHTGAVRTIAEHPIKRMIEEGLSVSCSTDNRLMSGVTLSHEFQALHEEAGIPMATLAKMQRDGVGASFLGDMAKRDALAAIDRAWKD